MNANQGFASNFHMPLSVAAIFFVIVVFAVAGVLFFSDFAAVSKVVVGFLF